MQRARPAGSNMGNSHHWLRGVRTAPGLEDRIPPWNAPALWAPELASLACPHGPGTPKGS